MLAQNKFYYNIIIVLHLVIFAFALIKGFLQNCRNMVAKSGEMLYITHVGHFPDVIRLERYRRGHNEPHSKCGRQETGARVRIPFSPPCVRRNFNGITADFYILLRIEQINFTGVTRNEPCTDGSCKKEYGNMVV